MSKHNEEAVDQMCSVKKEFLEISQNSQENTCTRISFLVKLQAWVLISKNNFFYITPLVAASDNVTAKYLSQLTRTILLTLLWRRPLPYRKQSIDLQSKSVDWFLYDNGLRHERVNSIIIITAITFICLVLLFFVS